MPTADQLSRRVRRLSWWLLVARLSRGRTQADVAAELGIVGSSYGDFERGETTPSFRQLVQLAAILDVPLSQFTDPPFTDEERLERDTGIRSERTRIELDVADEIEGTG